MARRNYRPSQVSGRARAEATAAAIIAQGRDIAARAAETMEIEDMPMNRYTFPVPTADCCNGNGACCCACSDTDGALDRVLETLCYQNQLLVDILGAVNALTAALLSTQCQK